MGLLEKLKNMSAYKKSAILVGVLVLLVVCAASAVVIWEATSSFDEETSSTPLPPYKQYNMIMIISDGFGPESETFARTMQDDPNHSLELDEMLIGQVRTFSSSSLITDSAAGATAYACAIHTYNDAVAVDDDAKPRGTVMEAAKRMGMTTGIVTKTRVTHATPAAYTSHVPYRDWEEDIAYQQAYNQSLDIIFGGGYDKYVNREDGINLLDYMTGERGYQAITTIDELEGELQMPVIGLFAESHMEFELDRVRDINNIVQPSLADMTSRALEILEENGNPFFILIEASHIDLAAHNHDAYAQYLEIIQLQEVAAIVKDFVSRNPNTYVISTSDHSTGGFALGRGTANGVYPDPYIWYPDALKQQTLSAALMAELILPNITAAPEIIKNYTGITITDEQYNYLVDQYNNPDSRFLKLGVGDIVAAAALLGYTTPGHAGQDVNLYSWGLKPKMLTYPNVENIYVGEAIAQEFELREVMEEITYELREQQFRTDKTRRIPSSYMHD